MLSDKFLDEMWQKCSWIRYEGPNEKTYPQDARIDSDQLRDLLEEIKTLTDDAKQRRTNNIRLEGENARLRAEVKNPVITAFMGKPMGYWIELQKSIEHWEYPSGLAWHNWQLKEENRELQAKLTEAINTNTEMRRTIDKCREELYFG